MKSRTRARLLLGCLVGLLGADAAQADKTSVICTPTGAASFASRIHVRCSQSFSGVRFFAYKSSDSAGAARYLSIATSALIAGRNVRIFYDPANVSGTSIGCQSKDCRLLLGLELF